MYHLSFPLPFPVHLTNFVPILCSPCLYLSHWCFSLLLLHNSAWITTCGLLLWLYLSQHLNQQKHVWNPHDLFQSQLFMLSQTLQVKIHSCGDSDVFLRCCLSGKPKYLHLIFNISWSFSIMASRDPFLLVFGIIESPGQLND